MPGHHPGVVNVADLPRHEFDHGDKFADREKWLADAAAGPKLEILPLAATLDHEDAG